MFRRTGENKNGVEWRGQEWEGVRSTFDSLSEPDSSSYTYKPDTAKTRIYIRLCFVICIFIYSVCACVAVLTVCVAKFGTFTTPKYDWFEIFEPFFPASTLLFFVHRRKTIRTSLLSTTSTSYYTYVPTLVHTNTLYCTSAGRKKIPATHNTRLRIST